MSCTTWNKVDAPVQNLSKIMLEEQERARSGQVREELISSEHPEIATKNTTPEILKKIEGVNNRNYEFNSDATIAKQLQYKFDKEYEEITTLEKRSGDAKISISYGNTSNLHKHSETSEDSDDDVDLADKKYWHCFESTEEDISSLTKHGKLLKDEEIVTILDKINNGRRNACNVKKIPRKIPTKLDCVKLPNYLLWNFEGKSEHQTLQQQIIDEKKSQTTVESYLNNPTRFVLFKFVCNGVFEVIDNVISINKESVIFHATGGINNSKEYAIKVFKIAPKKSKAYNKRKDKEIIVTRPSVSYSYTFSKYNQQENQYTDGCKLAEKEMRNLQKMHEIGLNCHEVVCLKRHILVTSFIGRNTKCPPRLREIETNEEEWQIIYDAVVDALNKLHNVGHIICDRLSEHNILWWDNKCWFTGIGDKKFVSEEHDFYLCYLYEACRTITRFFRLTPILSMKNSRNLYLSITGFEEFTL